MKKTAFRPTYFAYPYLVISAIFVVLPLVLVFVYAFLDGDGHFTADNFAQVFTESSNIILLLKTVGTALLATLICLVIAYPVALVLSSAPFNKMVILALMFIIPMWMNFVMRIMALKSLLFMMGVSGGFGATLIGLVYDFFPFMLLPIYTVLTNMDKSYIEAATDLGAGRLRTFVRVTLPLSLPGIASGVAMVFMPVFSAYAIMDLLGDKNTSVIGGKIANLFSTGAWGSGSALSFILLLLVIVTVVLSNLISRKAAKAEETANG